MQTGRGVVAVARRALHHRPVDAVQLGEEIYILVPVLITLFLVALASVSS